MPGFSLRIDPSGRLDPLGAAETRSQADTPVHGGPWQCLHFEDAQGTLFCYGSPPAYFGLPQRLAEADVNPAAMGLAGKMRALDEDWSGHFPAAFVSAHWSPAERRLTLWRDGTGLIPLYYACTGDGGLAVATHPATLAAHLGRRPGGPGLHEYLHLLDISPPATIYPGIAALAPGECVRWEPDRGVATHKTPTMATPADELTVIEAVAELERRLTEAIQIQLEAATHPAVFLSSGIDSSLLCALAARIRPDITALTVGFDDDRRDEAPLARAIANHLGLRHEVWRFGRHELECALEEYTRGADQPMADPAILVTLLAFRRARERFDRVLDGTGADELLGAMPPRHLRIATEWAARIPLPLRKLAKTIARRLPGAYAPVFDFVHPAETLRRWKGFSAREIKALTGESVDLRESAFYRSFERFEAKRHFERYSALLNAMPCDRLAQAARLSGLDVRFPYWTPPVPAWLAGLPETLRWRPDAPKYLLRLLLSRHVPPVLWEGPKRGFDFPLHDFLSAQDHRIVRRYVMGADWRGLLSSSAAARHAEAFIAGDASELFRIWALVILSAWLSHDADR